MDDDDILLDKITARLRTQRVSEVPMELLVSTVTSQPQVAVRYRLVAGSLAASLLAFLLWSAWSKPELDPQEPSISEVATLPRKIKSTKVDPVVVLLDVDLAEPLDQMASELVLLDAQIDKLRSQAALLDARRLADAMIVLN